MAVGKIQGRLVLFGGHPEPLQAAARLGPAQVPQGQNPGHSLPAGVGQPGGLRRPNAGHYRHTAGRQTGEEAVPQPAVEAAEPLVIIAKR
jgi:hypothetical protein